MNNKLSMYNVHKTETPFLHLMASCLEIGKSTIPQINQNLYSALRIFVLKCQTDWLTRTKVVPQKPLCLQTNKQILLSYIKTTPKWYEK